MVSPVVVHVRFGVAPHVPLPYKGKGENVSGVRVIAVITRVIALTSGFVAERDWRDCFVIAQSGSPRRDCSDQRFCGGT
jgi:hypothetical protein